MAPFATTNYSEMPQIKEYSVKSTLVVVRNIVGAAGLVFAAYVIAGAMPDLRRYIRISRM
jgi:ectoine hydroxylase-related dioxygenase (phytanoyl-CoA dioxygenase family)